MARKSKKQEEENDDVWEEEVEEESEEEEEGDSGSDYEVEKVSKRKSIKKPAAGKRKKSEISVEVKEKAKRSTSGKQKKASSSSTMGVTTDYLDDIKQVFNNFDSDNPGKMPTSKLKFAMRAMGFEPKNEEVKRISESYDKDGFIEQKDFVDLIVKRFTEKSASEEIMKAFQLFDKDHTGKITLADLQRVSDELGEKISNEELKEMIEEADLNGDSVIDEQEFLRIMKKTSLY